MISKQKDNLLWFEFELFQPYSNIIRHGCFTKRGGVSQKPYAGLNVGSNVGDDPLHVRENQKQLCACFENTIDMLCEAEQIHTTNSCLIQTKPEKPPAADILLTNRPNIILMIKHADCQAALLYDPVHHAACSVHAGWRGLVQRAYTKALQEMNKHFSTSANDLLVGIAPSLQVCHSEFVDWKKSFPNDLWTFSKPNNHMDLIGIAKEELISSGVLPEHIEASSLCTFDEQELFFSYRREKTTGRCGTCIQLGAVKKKPSE